MRDGKSSAVAAVASAAGVSDGSHADPADDLRQADLLRADLDLFETATIAPPKRLGRPAGTPNRSTTMLRKFLFSNGYRDPAEFLAALVTTGTAELAAKLECDAIEALKVQRQAATDLMPYFHQRMPQEADRKPAEARPLVVIMEGSARVVQAKAEGLLSAYDAEQDQGLSEPVDAPSHEDRSHDEG